MSNNHTSKSSTDSSSNFSVPVVVFAYNRPRYARNMVSVLRTVKPEHLLIVADGPKSDGGRDAQLVEATRHEFEEIDWPCKIDCHYSPVNLGCATRIRSGLDWAFGIVDQAVILEDDIDAVPEFFSWTQQMLSLYRDRDDIAMICGNNPLIRWPEGHPGTSAIMSRRGGWHGWATYSHAWRAVQDFDLLAYSQSVEDDKSLPGFEPALGTQFLGWIHELRLMPERSLAVDIDFTLKMAMSGRFAVCSTVNFIHHLGVGADSTHEVNSDDTLFTLPRPKLFIREITQLLPTDAVDSRFDRARVLLELLMRATNPRMARRLSKHQNLPLDPDVKIHLLPFVHAQETAAILNHLHSEGLDDEKYRYWYSAVSDTPEHGDTP